MKALRKWAAAYLIENKQKPVTHSDLVYAGVDSNGVKYYTWKDLSLLPNCRRIKLHGAAIFYDARLDENSLEMIASGIVQAADALSKATEAKDKALENARIIAYTQELNRRGEYAISEHWHIQVAGILHVTESENPAIWDSESHDKKCAQLHKELHASNAFFFKSPMYSELMNLSLGMESSLPLLFATWEQDKQKMEARLKVISSYKESETTEKVKKNG